MNNHLFKLWIWNISQNLYFFMIGLIFMNFWLICALYMVHSCCQSVIQSGFFCPRLNILNISGNQAPVTNMRYDIYMNFVCPMHGAELSTMRLLAKLSSCN